MSVPYAAQVMRESFLKSAAAGRMGVPTVPLTDLYNAAGDYIRERDGEVRFRTSVESFRAEMSHVQLGSAAGNRPLTTWCWPFPSIAWNACSRDSSASQPLRDALARFETSPITGIHLWFDREISDLEHAVLLDRTIQWMFHKSKLQKREQQWPRQLRGAGGQLVEEPGGEISSRRSWTSPLEELREFFPAARDAQPGEIDRDQGSARDLLAEAGHRRESSAPADRVAARLSGRRLDGHRLARDDGGRRAQRLPGGTIAGAGGGKRDATFLVPDLPPTGFMRLFG